MANASEPAELIVEGDFAKVHIQLAAGGADAHPKRTGPGTQLVWGGDDPSSPWGHLLALIEKGGGSVSYTEVHAGVLVDEAADLPRPSGAPGGGAAPAEEHHEPAAPPPAEPKPGEKPPVAVKPPSTPAQSAGEDHHVGAGGSGPMFEFGESFSYQGEEAKVWAHPRAANAGPRPLLVLLHGMNKSGEPHGSLNNGAGKKSGDWCHIGKLAQKLIDDGLVTPMIVAAPTNKGDAPWPKFDLAAFVNQVEQKCRDHGVEIDLDQVSLAAHSAGGGYPGRGLNKVAAEGGMFSGHKLRVLGIEDTRIIPAMAKQYADDLKKAGNDVTTLYAIHRGTGGWQTPEYNAGGGNPKFGPALGAPHKNTDHVVAAEVMDDIESYYDNGDDKPTRVSIKVKESVLKKYHTLWSAAGGYNGNLGAHSDMVPMWSWWALPRFYPQTEADKKLMAAHQAAQSQNPPPAPKPAKPPAGPPAVTGGDPNIPPAPPPWTNPAGDIAPKQTGAAEFAPADAAIYWPVRMEKHPWKRGVHYMGEDGKLYDPFGKHGGGCHFLASRGKNNERYHVGVDLNIGSLGAIVVACEAGTIINFYPFLVNAAGVGVSCLLVEHDSGVVINYGEVAHSSLKEFNLKVGDRVTAGQPIAKVGRCPEGDSMLHFETYPKAAMVFSKNHNISYSKANGAKFLEHYYNPSQYLLYIAKSGR